MIGLLLGITPVLEVAWMEGRASLIKSRLYVTIIVPIDRIHMITIVVC